MTAPLPDMPPDVRARLDETRALAEGTPTQVAGRLAAAVARNRAIHEVETINLDPAANVMNPAAEAYLAAGLGSRPSLGWPGAKYETGLEAIEEVEGIAAALAAQVFRARFAEVRVGSGALANLYAFLALTRPGDAIIVPPAAVGGHVTHHAAGAAGLMGLAIHPAPIDPAGYTVDVAGVAALAERVRPRLITIGGSLNLFPHPVAALRGVADAVGAKLLFDAAHLSGPIAGGAWPDPLAEGAHLVTMSTYKSLAGPPGGLILTDDAELAARLDRIAFPGLTANSDAGRIAALARTLIDWRAHGPAAAAAMVATAQALAAALAGEGLAVFAGDRGATHSHAFALEAEGLGGGAAAARRLHRAGLLACAIGLPGPGDGLRLGTSEIVRRGMGPADMPALARLIARALREPPEQVAPATRAFRAGFEGLRFVL